MRLLTAAQEELLATLRAWLGRLQVVLGRADAADEDAETLARSIEQLDRLFLLVIVGEFNAGKSAVINALLGRVVLEEGVTPTTTRIHILEYGPTAGTVRREGEIDLVTAPVDFLRDVAIVDTPGTNAIYREHEALTGQFVPRADLVLFVTSADRPFTESERAFLEAIRDWGKKVVFVINKIDIFDRAEDVASVERFVRTNGEALMGSAPEVFTVSARRAIRTKTAAPGADSTTGASSSGPPVPWDRFADLERFIVETLDANERLRLKLLNPLGVGERLIAQLLERVDVRMTLLKDDVSTIEEIEGQLGLYREDLAREFRYRLSHVDAVLLEFERRGMDFFDEVLRIGRVFDLLNKARLKSEFERKVVGEMAREVERAVHEAIDWMVASDLRQWQGVMDRVQRRRAAHAEHIVGDLAGTFTYDRARLLETVGRAAERAVATYDKDKEASAMADSVRTAVAGAALAQAGAISLGAVVTAVASTTFLDVTGLVAAGMIAVLGLFVIPVRRQQAKRTLRERIGAMRTQLMQSLQTQFDRELDASLHRINDAMAPYTRFVKAERDRLAAQSTELHEIAGGLGTVRAKVEAI